MVAAIWAYETAAQYFNRQNDGSQYTPRSHKHALVPGQFNSSHKASRYSALRNQSEGPPLPKSPVSGSRPPGVKGKDSVVELEKIWCDGNRIYGRIKQGLED